MSNSRLQLDDCVVRSLEIKSKALTKSDAVAAAQHGEAEIAIQFKVLRNGTNTRQFLIPLQVSVTWPGAEDATFECVAVGLSGIFSLPEDMPEEEVHQYVPLLCVTNLYGIARGMVAQATGSFGEGAYYLPLLNMTEVVKQAEMSEAQAEE